jgi:uncharacterized protein YggE
MKKWLLTLALAASHASVCAAQASGNVGYAQSGGSNRAEQSERAKRSVARDDQPPTATSMFVEASVLANVRADEHVAVFGLMQECAAVPECNQKMDATVRAFLADLAPLGVGPSDAYVDFASQNKIYGFRVAANVAREQLVGFELKKNVAVRYRDRDLLDKLILAAARHQIFDLIKVDYVVRDPSAVQNQLMEEAAKVIEQKAVRYTRLLGIKFHGPAQVYAERPSAYFPTEMYDSYTAFESESVERESYEESKMTVHRARKSRTFFFNPLNADGFDRVINPVVIEPVVQFTLYLKVKYEIDQPPAK